MFLVFVVLGQFAVAFGVCPPVVRVVDVVCMLPFRLRVFRIRRLRKLLLRCMVPRLKPLWRLCWLRRRQLRLLLLLLLLLLVHLMQTPYKVMKCQVTHTFPNMCGEGSVLPPHLVTGRFQCFKPVTSLCYQGVARL